MLARNSLAFHAHSAAYDWVKTTKSAAELLEGPVYIEQNLVSLIFVDGADDYLADEANKLEAAHPTADA